ncbi:hypothetical protein [Chengkuizengella sediminis]|uniref:hypothetical protein n=1 Tax=Chengkuizengella sediminis TaxID=1885917 RepID=UPI00138958E1|nr:hypothetical protein [Chengkuizengella sediminis]NDI35673.1 hypothetical protein [Chengkuizengella sediminis]
MRKRVIVFLLLSYLYFFFLTIDFIYEFYFSNGNAEYTGPFGSLLNLYILRFIGSIAFVIGSTAVAYKEMKDRKNR